MDVHVLSAYFHRYGAIVIFVIVFLEYLNMPGFPSGVIMPLAGIWASKGNIAFISVLILSVVAGICGSWALYFLGRYGGDLVLKKYVKKFPKQKAVIDRTIERVQNKGYLGIFVGKLIPVFRTIISIPAGVLKINFIGYTVASTMGIFVWNLLFVGAGYIFGEAALKFLA
ncbi:MAG: DedA family protein [Clostridiales bacterium]|nr:DedA family protein [Clostridiales bacterium]